MLAERLEEWSEEARLRGLLQGRAEGRAEGAAEGSTRLLVRLVEARFGRVDAALNARIAAATDEQRFDWAVRCATAPSLEDLFGK